MNIKFLNSVAAISMFCVLLSSCKENPNPDADEIGSSGTTQPENQGEAPTSASSPDTMATAVGSAEDVASGQQRTDGTSGNNGAESAKVQSGKEGQTTAIAPNANAPEKKEAN